MTNRLKEPPVEAIHAGYLMTQARLKFKDKNSYYLVQAIEALQAAREVMVRDHGAYQMQASPALEKLWTALHIQEQYRSPSPDRPMPYSMLNAGQEMVGTAHSLSADVMEKLGFRPITLEDFKQFGAGGGR